MSDTPETDATFKRDMRGDDICALIMLCMRLERERNLALAIARKYYNGPEVRNFPNVKV